ncbi:hypothetical protein [Natranaerobius thermophilus]|uniref:Holin n=1 Tax=Natranaerobius thermophilus (strain ATCC BAA-1301 / DSM 18059 / JW/NM-WN-LF) TaxID=457570 RepID=B2A6D8_NATTJ|nr:hypothetical protein [Natranaerobius thermophilus]ACB84149.1 conserved hypothetical protein [Natranaerobius thermophilus JW/NM-WN-LF]
MEFEAYDVALIPFVMGMIQVFKKLGMPKKAAPVVALIVGNVMGYVYLAPGEPEKAIIWGTSIGLSAIGAYSGAKNTMEYNK